MQSGSVGFQADLHRHLAAPRPEVAGVAAAGEALRLEAERGLSLRHGDVRRDDVHAIAHRHLVELRDHLAGAQHPHLHGGAVAEGGRVGGLGERAATRQVDRQVLGRTAQLTAARARDREAARGERANAGVLARERGHSRDTECADDGQNDPAARVHGASMTRRRGAVNALVQTRLRRGTRQGDGMRGKLVLATAAATFALGAGTAQAAVSIDVLSNRADLISGGDALVAVNGGTPSSVTLNGQDISGEFAPRPNGRYEGLVSGLSDGANTLQAHLPDGSGAQITITNHAIGGPVFAGPQIEPWVCQSGAVDRQCNQPIAYTYKYMPATGGGFQTYDPSNPPPSALIASTTTDQGVTVPYIIREETGYEDRDQYAIATLFQPGQPWQPWAPQQQWNHKLVIEHGASCGADRQTGTAPSVEDDAALSRGFAVMSTALDNAGHNCDLVTEAESLIMAKEHLVESYGQI